MLFYPAELSKNKIIYVYFVCMNIFTINEVRKYTHLLTSSTTLLHEKPKGLPQLSPGQIPSDGI